MTRCVKRLPVCMHLLQIPSLLTSGYQDGPITEREGEKEEGRDVVAAVVGDDD